MGFLLDIVPNHVGVDDAKANPWWWDVLTHGRGSRYASYFDIDWRQARSCCRSSAPSPTRTTRKKVISSEVTLSDDRTELRYYERTFPSPGPGGATSGADPAEVHARQHYRLTSWNAARRS